MSGCMRPWRLSSPTNRPSPLRICRRCSRSKRLSAVSSNPMSLSCGSRTAVCASGESTTAGSCLWSPIKTNFPMALSPFSVLAHSSPRACGSNICDASSKRAQSNCLMRKSCGVPVSVVSVPIYIYVWSSSEFTARRLAAAAARLEKRRGR